MQNKISMETVICQAENGFSFDESVIKLSEACAKKALTGILEMNLFLLRQGNRLMQHIPYLNCFG